MPVDEFGGFVGEVAIELWFFLVGECGVGVKGATGVGPYGGEGVFIEAVESPVEGVVCEF